jgi:hypothetical protein
MTAADDLDTLLGMKVSLEAKRAACKGVPELTTARKPPSLWVFGADTISGSNESHDMTRLAAPSFASYQPDQPDQAADTRSRGSAHSPESRCSGSHGSHESARTSSLEEAQTGAHGPCANNSRQPSVNRRKTQRQVGDPAAGKWGPHVTKSPPFKKGRITWSAELHRDFLASLTAIGLRAAVPKTIMQVCSSTHFVPAYCHVKPALFAK